MIFYFIELTDKSSNKVFHKFGITSSNVKQRFSTVHDERWGDFSIKELATVNSLENDIFAIETGFLQAYPKNMYLESYLGRPATYYDGLGGITETVILVPEQIQSILETISKINNIKHIKAITEDSLPTAFITSAGYLSVVQDVFDNVQTKNVFIEGNMYDYKQLQASITYTDSTDNEGRKLYRWNSYGFRTCIAS